MKKNKINKSDFNKAIKRFSLSMQPTLYKIREKNALKKIFPRKIKFTLGKSSWHGCSAGEHIKEDVCGIKERLDALETQLGYIHQVFVDLSDIIDKIE